MVTNFESSYQATNVVEMPSRVPPNSIESEISVLGGILFQPEAIKLVSPILKPEDFYVSAHQEIYRTMLSLSVAGMPPDLLVVADKLGKRLPEIGGRNKLASLVSSVVSTINIDVLAQLIKEKARLRSIIRIANHLTGNAMSQQEESSAIIDQCLEDLIALRQSSQKSRLYKIDELITDVFAEIEAANSGEDAGHLSVATGLYDLDALSVFPIGCLTCVGGRGGMGKSTFAVDIALRVAKSGLPVAFFALEMTASQMIRKAIARLAAPNLPVELLFKRNALGEGHWTELSKAITEALGLPFWLNDSPVMTPSELRANLTQMRAECGEIGMVVVDYVQLMHSDRPTANRQEQVGQVLRDLRAITKDFNCSTLALAQLNRETDKRTDKRPNASDFRDTGEFEQESAVMLGLYRDEKYNSETPDKGIMEISVLKSRFGQDMDVIKLLFDPRFGQLKNLASRLNKGEI